MGPVKCPVDTRIRIQFVRYTSFSKRTDPRPDTVFFEISFFLYLWRKFSFALNFEGKDKTKLCDAYFDFPSRTNDRHSAIVRKFFYCTLQSGLEKNILDTPFLIGVPIKRLGSVS
jgi:hypothetical protein